MTKCLDEITVKTYDSSSMHVHKNNQLISVRQYGSGSVTLLLLHGGPGAPGYMAPVAKRLAERFRVIEPFQCKGNLDEPLTVARHMTDLKAVIETYCPDRRPILVGHSWGAMLGLAFAAENPESTASLVLIGCGTFDAASRRRMNAIRQERMGRHVFQRLQERIESTIDPDERLKLQGKLMMQLDSYDLMHVDDEVVYYDALGHEQTWRDMMRLQNEGIYPAAFKAIEVSVLMLHGQNDPHPGTMIRDALRPCLPQLEYHEWTHCGHYPWLEKATKESFYTVMLEWLMRAPPSD